MEERTREELVLITLIVFKIWWSVNRTLNLAESLDCLLDHLGDIQGFCFLEIEKQCLGLLFIGNWKTLFYLLQEIWGRELYQDSSQDYLPCYRS